MADDACDSFEGDVLAPTSPYARIVQPGERGSSLWFGCSVGEHCASGQKVRIDIPDETCASVLELPFENVLKPGYTPSSDMEFAYDSETHGHATYRCGMTMIEAALDYEKAVPYLWCVYPHCVKCQDDDGNLDQANCPTSDYGLDTIAQCQSATLTMIAFSERKEADPDFDKSEEYYQTAISVDPNNCGARSYLVELYLQKDEETNAKLAFADLCGKCGGANPATELALAAYNAHFFSSPTCSLASSAMRASAVVIATLVSATTFFAVSS
jgi:hypothetical protein